TVSEGSRTGASGNARIGVQRRHGAVGGKQARRSAEPLRGHAAFANSRPRRETPPDSRNAKQPDRPAATAGRAPRRREALPGGGKGLSPSPGASERTDEPFPRQPELPRGSCRRPDQVGTIVPDLSRPEVPQHGA